MKKQQQTGLSLIVRSAFSTPSRRCNCTFYQQYTTPEAMVKAAEDYSSRKMKIVL